MQNQASKFSLSPDALKTVFGRTEIRPHEAQAIDSGQLSARPLLVLRAALGGAVAKAMQVVRLKERSGAAYAAVRARSESVSPKSKPQVRC